MSECRFFWTNFYKSVETDPVCPVTGAQWFLVDLASNILGAEGEELMSTIEPSPAGEDGVNLVDIAEPLTFMGPPAEWVDFGAAFGRVGLAIELSSGEPPPPPPPS